MATVVITGANRGLGLAHATLYARRGWRVHACCRAPSEAEALRSLARQENGAARIHAYDALDAASPGRIKEALGDEPVDVLLNNAGVMGPRGRQGFEDADGGQLAETFAVNAIAPLALTRALIDNVAASERRVVANQSSLMGSIGDNASGGYYAYRASKAALNMITRSLAIDLAPRSVIVVALHPGWVRTAMGGPSAPLTAEKSAKGEQEVIDRLSQRSSGRFFNYDGRELPW